MAAAVTSLLLAYLIGSFPTGVLVSKVILGRDVREFGSGNPGAVNVWRVFGLGWGLFVVTFDAGKGFLAVLLTESLTGGNWETLPTWGGLAAVIGHIWSPFTRFRGGKGAGVAWGMGLAVMPFAALIALGLWLVVAALTRYASVAALSAVLFYSGQALVFGSGQLKDKSAWMILPILLTWTHRSNLRRLLERRELRIGHDESLTRQARSA